MDASSEIARKLNVLSSQFRDRFGFDLWSAWPVTEISEIRRPVNNEDDLRLRTNSLVAIFEVLNKSDFDRKSGVKEKSTRDSFVSLLKHESLTINHSSKITSKRRWLQLRIYVTTFRIGIVRWLRGISTILAFRMYWRIHPIPGTKSSIDSFSY